MVDGLKLNMGPGMNMAPAPWLNVEVIQRDNHPRADILIGDQTLTEAVRSRWPDAPVVAICACHCLEHIPIESIMGVVGEWFDLLAPGGQLGITQPDFWIALRYYKQGLIDEADLIRHGEPGDRYDAARWEQWFRDGQLDSFALHSWNSVPERVHGLLRAVGFEVEVREPTRAAMAGFPITGEGGAQMAVVATKPA